MNMNTDSIVIIEPGQAIGRQVKAVHHYYGSDDMKMQFTDGTFVVMKLQRGEFGDGDSMVALAAGTYVGELEDFSDRDREFFGIIDSAERARRQKEHDADIQARREAYEKTQWETLNKKFGAK